MDAKQSLPTRDIYHLNSIDDFVLRPCRIIHFNSAMIAINLCGDISIQRVKLSNTQPRYSFQVSQSPPPSIFLMDTGSSPEWQLKFGGGKTL